MNILALDDLNIDRKNTVSALELLIAQGHIPTSNILEAQTRQEAQEIVAMEIKQAQKDTELLVNEATTQLNSQKEKALQALEKQVNTLSEQIKNKLLSGQLAG